MKTDRDTGGGSKSVDSSVYPISRFDQQSYSSPAADQAPSTPPSARIQGRIDFDEFLSGGHTRGNGSSDQVDDLCLGSESDASGDTQIHEEVSYCNYFCSFILCLFTRYLYSWMHQMKSYCSIHI